MKNKQLNTWLWRWHIISALISLPIVLLLSLTGIIYLFKTDFNDWAYKEQRFFVGDNVSAYSLQHQLDVARQYSKPKTIDRLVIPDSNNATGDSQAHATTFYLSGKGHAKNAVYVNPSTAEVTGTYQQKESLMYWVRKLHGELLLGLPGTLVVEWVACWLIIMILTGLYLWWPQKRWRIEGFFTLRRTENKRLQWRDLHAVLGFYASLTVLVILLGGLPWTEVFGGAYKAIQGYTHTGYPADWRKPQKADIPPSKQDIPLTLDKMVAVAQSYNLPGKVTVSFPDNAPYFTVSNRSFYLRDQQRLHFNRYNGSLLSANTWDNVGVMMQARQFLMRFHQGQYGLANWYLVLLASVLFMVSNIAGLVSYLKRKQPGSLSLPENKQPFVLGYAVITAILLLSIALPLFGASVVLIYGAFILKGWRAKIKQVVYRQSNATD